VGLDHKRFLGFDAFARVAARTYNLKFRQGSLRALSGLPLG
jgi:hypothetical protein